jgi:hypothetical protein
MVPVSDQGLELLRVEAVMDLEAAELLGEVARRFLPYVETPPGNQCDQNATLARSYRTSSYSVQVQ